MSDAADKTIVVRVDVVKVHPRYKKVVKRSTRLHAHDEENQAKLGDVVRIVETRPLSRMKRWRLQDSSCALVQRGEARQWITLPAS